MNISFTSDTLVNSTVIDSATGQILFELSAPRHHSRIDISLQDAQNKVVGEYKGGKSDTEVIYRGKTMPAMEWLVKKHWYSSSRTFMAHNGRAYKWKGSNQLLDSETRELIASAHRKTWSSGKGMNIDVGSDGLPILDAIVLSFVICVYVARRQASAAAAANANANATAVLNAKRRGRSTANATAMSMTAAGC